VQVRLSLGVLDLSSGQLERGDGTTSLSQSERQVLAYLHEQGRSVDQDELLEKVWGYSSKVRARTVRVTINRIRTKIERDSKEPEHLLTEVGLGYRFAPLPPSTTLIGRDAERQALACAGRLVCLVGPGGVGKTSLARELAERVGAVWVDCGDARSAEALVDCVSRALGMALARDPVEAIRRAQPDCLVMDNLEQVDDPSPIAQWTEGRVVMTSRRPLGLPEEQVLAVRPLVGEPARELLALRWTQAGGEPLTDGDCAAIAEALDGLPLALELVSSWAVLLTAADVRSRLADSLGWVADERRAGRHSSLLAVVSGSWALSISESKHLSRPVTRRACHREGSQMSWSWPDLRPLRGHVDPRAGPVASAADPVAARPWLSGSSRTLDLECLDLEAMRLAGPQPVALWPPLGGRSGHRGSQGLAARRPEPSSSRRSGDRRRRLRRRPGPRGPTSGTDGVQVGGGAAAVT